MTRFNGACGSFIFQISFLMLQFLAYNQHYRAERPKPMFVFGFIFTFSLLSISFSLYKKLHGRRTEERADQNEPPAPELPLAESACLCSHTDPESVAGSDQGGKRKKKRAKKKKEKRLESSVEEEASTETSPDPGRVKPELICLYPFTSSGSATQRKIKQQYDELVKSHESKGLTLAQVAQFANCLVEARTELQHKSEVIHRKFSITKALLFKAERSSFDRLRQQIYKLEFEQKRLEEDAFVYNWLQQQLKLSPAYKKMLEISASMESKAKTEAIAEREHEEDADLPDISFEELLAQEKKDSFWQKLGKSRAAS